jgi:hypothetical protein
MTVLTNFRIDEETRRQFHIYCINNNTSVAARLREYIAWDLKGGGMKSENPNTTAKKKDIKNWLDGMRDTSERRWEDSY